MLKFVKQKMKNKLWLTICLVLGMTFLIASFACQPMFKSGSLDKLMSQLFTDSIETSNKFPAVIGKTAIMKADKNLTVKSVNDEVSRQTEVWEKYLTGIDTVSQQTVMSLDEVTSSGSFGSKGHYISISYMPDIEEHISMLNGVSYSDYTNTEPIETAYGTYQYDELYPCIMSLSAMDKFGLVTGEVVDFVQIEGEDKKTLKCIITGIFGPKDNGDVFWYERPQDFETQIFVSEQSMNDIISKYNMGNITYSTNLMLDYTDIKNSNVDDVNYYLKQFAKIDSGFSDNFSSLIKDFSKERKSVSVMLWVLELPILGMVLAFVYMVSKQIVETEKNEIAMLKSRGNSRIQIIGMYAMQSGIQAVIGMLIGIPLGYLLCKLAASTNDFLTFSFGNTVNYRFVWQMIVYGMLAALIGIVFILIPVIAASKVSIVERKAASGIDKKMLWEKYFFDVILLGVSIYLLYYFNQTKDNIRERAMSGNKMDPMIFLNTILFIIAFGLVVLRLVHYLVKLIYRIGRNKWKPVMYVSFLQITRTFSKQGFISVFLVLTVSLGLFNANAARTINQNKEDRIVYEMGADAKSMERWNSHPYRDDNFKVWNIYEEPDYVRYTDLIDEGICDSVAKVLRYDNTKAKCNAKTVENCQVMAIQTDMFGKTATLKHELTGNTHWYTYLNKLAENSRGAIISENLAEALGVEVGGYVNFNSTYNGEIMDDKSLRCEVVAIVPAWPGFNQYYYEDGKLCERYLIVANYATVNKTFDTMPYEVWYNLADNVTSDELYDALVKKNIPIITYEDTMEKVEDMKASPSIQITNGMFTLCFIIALVLCAVGFLIYWISSIRQRELLFGVYRAMGMSVKEINKMLVNEHIFSTMFSVIAGGLVGMLATLLYVKLFGIIYLPEKHNMDIYIYFQTGDIIKLFAVIAVMIVICLLVLRKLIKSMNITQALKLGED